MRAKPAPVTPTPGEWSADCTAFAAVKLPDGEVWTILRPAKYDPTVRGNTRSRANARLMAASCKLARALDAALALIHEYEPNSTSHGAVEARFALAAAFEDPDSALS